MNKYGEKSIYIYNNYESTDIDISDVVSFIDILFGKYDEVVFDIYKREIHFNVYTLNKEMIKTKVPYNIKHKSYLGYYEHKYNLMILRISNMFKVRIGIGTNKPIRYLLDVI